MEGAFAVLVERLVVAEERKAVAVERHASSEERVAIALERLSEAWNAVAGSERVVASRKSRETRVGEALRLLAQWGPDKVSEIADTIGVHRTTPYKWPAFATALRSLQASQDWVKRDPRAVRREET